MSFFAVAVAAFVVGWALAVRWVAKRPPKPPGHYPPRPLPPRPNPFELICDAAMEEQTRKVIERAKVRRESQNFGRYQG